MAMLATHNVDRDGRTRWRIAQVLLVLHPEQLKCPAPLVTGLENPSRSINPDPPQDGPVLCVKIDKKRSQRKCPKVANPLERIRKTSASSQPRSTEPIRSERSSRARRADARPE